MKLSRRAEKVAPSSTLKLTAEAKRLKAEGVDVVSFTAGEPDFGTPEHIKEAACQALREEFTKYTPVGGSRELKQAICEKFKNDNGLVYKEDNIVVSCGAKHSLYNIFQAILDEGDEVLMPSPYWVSYPEMVKLAGGVPRIIETREENSFKIDSKSLKAALSGKSKALILNSPANPTGAVYRQEELKELAEALKASGCWIVSDEIYEKIIYDSLSHVSIASFDDELKKRTIVVNGVSKAYSMTGWRIGYLAAPPEIADAVSRIQSHSTSNPTSISQRAALAALRGDQSRVEAMVAEFARRRDLLMEGVSRISGFSCIKPQGAFYLFCNISGTGMKSAKLAERLLQEVQVAVIPGEGFGTDKHIRLSFAVSAEEIKKGLERIARWRP